VEIEEPRKIPTLELGSSDSQSKKFFEEICTYFLFLDTLRNKRPKRLR
jgi:hypothetical protein